MYQRLNHKRLKSEALRRKHWEKSLWHWVCQQMDKNYTEGTCIKTKKIWLHQTQDFCGKGKWKAILYNGGKYS